MREENNILEIANISNITYLGFIFTQKSKRFVGNDFKMPFLPAHIQKIGVFLNQTIDEILEKCLKYHLDGIQLHGEESPEYCLELHHLLAKSISLKKIKIIKVFSINEDFEAEILTNYTSNPNICDFILLDTKGKDAGGNGVTFDWNILKNDYFSNSPKSIFLSGGISLENVENLFSFLKENPKIPIVCLDINSKFEDDIALKNPEKIKLMMNYKL